MTTPLVQHTCAAINRPLLLPITVERYNSKVIVKARCIVCSKDEFETMVDKLVAPSKGTYLTV